MTAPPLPEIVSVFYIFYTLVNRPLLSSRICGITKRRPSHGLLPGLLIFMVVLLVTEGDFLFLLSAACFSVSISV